MNHVNIDISQVLAKSDSKQVFKKIETFSPIELDEGVLEFSCPVGFDLSIENVGAGVQVSGNVEGEVSLSCCRCLQRFSYPVKLRVNELFREYEQEEKLPPEGERFEIVKKSIDIGQLTEQAFLLALPVKILCRQDCKGLCPACGKNLNEGKCKCKTEQVDPRLSKLKDLLE